MQQPTLTQEQYDAIMALQPHTIEDHNALVNAFIREVTDQGGDIGDLEEELKSTPFFQPETYSLTEVRIQNTKEFREVVGVIIMMILTTNNISIEQRQAIISDIVEYGFYLLPHIGGMKNQPIPLFKVA